MSPNKLTYSSIIRILKKALSMKKYPKIPLLYCNFCPRKMSELILVFLLVSNDEKQNERNLLFRLPFSKLYPSY